MILKRIMTRKSTIGFGKYKHYTVGHLIEMRCFKALISIYYRMNGIWFTDDVLNEIGITEEWRIEKPGKDRAKHIEFLKEKGHVSARTRDSADNMKKEHRQTKGYLRSKNQKT